MKRHTFFYSVNTLAWPVNCISVCLAVSFRPRLMSYIAGYKKSCAVANLNQNLTFGVVVFTNPGDSP